MSIPNHRPSRVMYLMNSHFYSLPWWTHGIAPRTYPSHALQLPPRTQLKISHLHLPPCQTNTLHHHRPNQYYTCAIPFTRKSDLKRHQSSSTSGWSCAIKSCRKLEKLYPRKDKCLAHMQSAHCRYLDEGGPP